MSFGDVVWSPASPARWSTSRVAGMPRRSVSSLTLPTPTASSSTSAAMLSLSWIISRVSSRTVSWSPTRACSTPLPSVQSSGRISRRRSGSRRPASTSVSTSSRIGTLNRLAAGYARAASTPAEAPLRRSTTARPRLPPASDPSSVSRRVCKTASLYSGAGARAAAGGRANVTPETSSRSVSGPRLTTAAASSSTSSVTQPRNEPVWAWRDRGRGAASGRTAGRGRGAARKRGAGRGRVRAKDTLLRRRTATSERRRNDELRPDPQRPRIGQVIERLDAFDAGLEAHRDLDQRVARGDRVVGLQDLRAGLDLTRQLGRGRAERLGRPHHRCHLNTGDRRGGSHGAAQRRSWLPLADGPQRRHRLGPIDHLQQAKAQAEQSDQDRHRGHAQRVALQPGSTLVTAPRTPRPGRTFEVS